MFGELESEPSVVTVVLAEFPVRVMRMERVTDVVASSVEEKVRVLFGDNETEAVTNEEIDAVSLRVPSVVAVTDSLIVTVRRAAELLPVIEND